MSNTGLVIKESNVNFEETYSNLIKIIDGNPNLKIILELDHSNNASKVDLELRPTKIVMFGNPNLGTPLMSSSPTTSIDLPQKIVVFQEGNSVKVCYNDPMYLKERHGISGKDEVLEKVSNALNMITNKAIN